MWLPVAGARAPFRMWNIADDTRPVGIDGSSLRKALNVAPVLLTVDDDAAVEAAALAAAEAAADAALAAAEAAA